MIEVKEIKVKQESLERDCLEALKEMDALKEEVSKVFEEFAESAEVKFLLEKINANNLSAIRVNIENNLDHIHEIFTSKSGQYFIETLVKLISLSFKINSLLNEYSNNQVLNIIKFSGIEVWAEVWTRTKSIDPSLLNGKFVDQLLNAISSVSNGVAQDLYTRVQGKIRSGL